MLPRDGEIKLYINQNKKLNEFMSRLYHSLERYTRVYTYFMTVVLGPTWAYEQRDKLVTLQW